MRPMCLTTPLYAPDGIGGFARRAERFDDGLVHNHHWAVTAEEAYPCTRQASATHGHCGDSLATSNQSWRRGAGETRPAHDHDDGLVHNHDWAVRAS
ncbi:hypothetical protein [Rhodopila sp.]|uniref:hypothetical protein n=1 Tax=Rhodopila sp. TaxID=2480087 RepID=UPI003D0CE558